MHLDTIKTLHTTINSKVMSLKKNVLLLTFFLSCQFIFSQQVVSHEVKAGDTLYSLSKKYNVSVQSIQKMNNLNSETIKAGQVLRIPTNK